MENKTTKYIRRKQDILIFPSLLVDLGQQNLYECVKRITAEQTRKFKEMLSNIDNNDRVDLIMQNNRVAGISVLNTFLKRCSE